MFSELKFTAFFEKKQQTVTKFKLIVVQQEGAAVAQWLRCCATIRKVAGSIPDGVIGIFH